MVDLFYGTGNVSKFKNMEAILEELSIRLISPRQLGRKLPEVAEDGDSMVENARKKALAYYRASGLPAMSVDSGLYLEGVAPEEQPGLFVRRVKGKVLTDEEFISYYSGLAGRMGGRVRARFVNGVCVVRDEERMKCAQGSFISTDWFWIVDKPHPLRLEGFPMESIAVCPGSEKYRIEALQEKGEEALGENMVRGFRQFFREYLAGNDQWRLEDDFWS